MTKRVIVAALMALAGCSMPDEGRFPPLAHETDTVRQVFQYAYQDVPFAEGSVKVVLRENRALRTYTLVPCHGGARICAGSARGRAGEVVRGREFWQVSGTHHGLTFNLSPGGDGYAMVAGVPHPVAWAHAAR